MSQHYFNTFWELAPANCNFYNKTANRTILITNFYEGIPDTLILNFCSWILLLILFTIMRHQAWDYGRLALVNSNGGNKRWTQLFYAPGNEDNYAPTPERTTLNHNTISDHGMFSWILITFKLKKDQILMHSGPDAVHYLSFQQHLMIVMVIITFISIVIVLPINFQGTLYGNASSFGHTTLSNLAPESHWLWVHVIIAILYVPLVVLIMRRSSGRNAFKKAPTRTIMITNISPNDRNKTIIRNYIQELFPDINIQDVQLAYNIAKLTVKNAEFEKVINARLYCENHVNRKSIKVKPDFCSCQAVDAYEYYQNAELKLGGEVARLRASALNEPLGIAFITVTTVAEAQMLVTHFRPGSYRDWNLVFAPSPFDIFWENLSVGTSRWYIKWAFINLILFLVLFFLTTPAIFVNALSALTPTQNSSGKSGFSPLVLEFLPTLMLWILSALMPVIVAFSDKWFSHWTRSLQNYSIMTKTFGYLLFMILILPSLGLTSAQAFIQWTFSNDNSSYRWECVFLPDKGAFFVNYIITAAFIGTALELLRFPELIVYAWELCTAKSKAETPYIRKSILIEFPFGVHYAWTVMVFTMSTVYSLACPLIMPFAMVYICFKHFVDRHNLYFAYGPSNMISQNGGKIHSTAVTMTKVSVIVLLTIMSGIAAIRTKGLDLKLIVLIISLVITLVLFTFMSPIKRCTMRRPSITDSTGSAPPYVADVLINKQLAVNDSPGFSGYGSEATADTNINQHTGNQSIDI